MIPEIRKTIYIFPSKYIDCSLYTYIGFCISTEEDDEQDADSDPLGIVLAWKLGMLTSPRIFSWSEL